MEFLQSHTFTAVRIFSVLTVFAQVLTALLLVIFLKDVFSRSHSSITKWIARHGLLLMLIVALAATLGSLFFSEIAGWTPCKDCWLQRIVMYPQALLLAMALWKRDRGIAPYIVGLCLIGIVIATSHYMTQLQAAWAAVNPDGTLKPCDATGVSCAATQIKFTFGYITLPMMALTAFVLNAMGSVMVMRGIKRA